jgi:hypothetical protein
MVRFSDMLGGNTDPERGRPATAPDPVPTDAIPEAEPEPEPDAQPEHDAQPEPDAEPEPEPTTPEGPPSLQTPEAVLDRLTQYATSARAAEPAPEPTDDGPVEINPAGDDLLPHGKADSRKRRRK